MAVCLNLAEQFAYEKNWVLYRSNDCYYKKYSQEFQNKQNRKHFKT